jgi:hypothetical protein
VSLEAVELASGGRVGPAGHDPRLAIPITEAARQALDAGAPSQLDGWPRTARRTPILIALPLAATAGALRAVAELLAERTASR